MLIIICDGIVWPLSLPCPLIPAILLPMLVLLMVVMMPSVVVTMAWSVVVVVAVVAVVMMVSVAAVTGNAPSRSRTRKNTHFTRWRELDVDGSGVLYSPPHTSKIFVQGNVDACTEIDRTPPEPQRDGAPTLCRFHRMRIRRAVPAEHVRVIPTEPI